MFYAYLNDYLTANHITAEQIAEVMHKHPDDIRQYIAAMDSARIMDTANREAFAAAVNTILDGTGE